MMLLCVVDEPTTGLDSAGAMSVMLAVRDLSSTMGVICTIHQPSQEIVDMFDHILLLKPGGYMQVGSVGGRVVMVVMVCELTVCVCVCVCWCVCVCVYVCVCVCSISES